MRQAVAHLSHAGWVAREKENVEKGWKTSARRALLAQIASQYQSASAPQKKQIVSHFVTSTGYMRKYAVTQAGPLLKQQIPIRTFAQWDEAQPGFLEVDLVAHCGPTRFCQHSGPWQSSHPSGMMLL